MFSGQATGRVLDAATLAADLEDYRPEMGAVNRDLILQHHGARDHVVALLAAIAEREPGERAPDALREVGRLTALATSWELTAREFRTMHWPLREHAARSEQETLRASEAARSASAERDAAVAERGRALRERDQAVRERDDAARELELLAARMGVLEARLAAANGAGEESARRARLDAMRATRAWRLASGYWRGRDRAAGARDRRP